MMMIIIIIIIYKSHPRTHKKHHQHQNNTTSRKKTGWKKINVGFQLKRKWISDFEMFKKKYFSIHYPSVYESRLYKFFILQGISNFIMCKRFDFNKSKRFIQKERRAMLFPFLCELWLCEEKRDLKSHQKGSVFYSMTNKRTCNWFFNELFMLNTTFQRTHLINHIYTRQIDTNPKQCEFPREDDPWRDWVRLIIIIIKTNTPDASHSPIFKISQREITSCCESFNPNCYVINGVYRVYRQIPYSRRESTKMQ